MAGRRRRRDRPKAERPPQVSRRRLLEAIGALILGGVFLWIFARLGRRAPDPGVAKPPDFPTNRSDVFPAGALPLLYAVANGVVPRFGNEPSASEIDLLPRLDRTLALSEEGPAFYRTHWTEFAAALRARAPAAPEPDPSELQAPFEAWYREARRNDPSLEARYFEGLRRAVLLAYYSSPEGWRAAGYPGPVHRANPVGGAPD